MKKEEFYKWCNIQESNLFKCSIGMYVADLMVFVVYGSLIGLLLSITKYIPNTIKNMQPNSAIFNYISPNVLKWIFIALIILITVFLYFLLFRLMKWLKPLSRVQYLSCLLNKISDRLQFNFEQSNNNELIRLLKNLKRVVKFERRFSSTYLFKQHMQIQNQFYDQLEDLPKRIYHAFKNDKLNSIKKEAIKELAYYIFTDDDQKVQVLNQISSSYPETLTLNKVESLGKIKPFFEKKWFQLLLWCLALVILAVGVYFYLGIDKNYVFIGFLGLIGVIISIIYKK